MPVEDPRQPDDRGQRFSAEADLWTDTQGVDWELIASDDSLRLRSGDTEINIPRSRLAQDLIISDYDADRLIVRVSTFDREVTFVVAREQADALLGRAVDTTPAHRVPDPPEVRHANVHAETDHPCVSPLAVAALLCAAISFLPVIGWPAMVAAVVLLVVHRIRLPRTARWRHSQRMAGVAFGLLVFGGLVSARAFLEIRDSGAGPGQAELRSSSSQRQSADEESTHWGVVAAGMFVVLASLTIHESAHAITAWWMGDDLAMRLGRVTLNPLSHIDPVGSVIFPLVLYLMNMGVVGWARPVPTDVSHCLRPRRAHILIALAGPVSNLLLAAASLTAYLAVGFVVAQVAPGARVMGYADVALLSPVHVEGVPAGAAIGAFLTILNLSFVVNIFLAFFNLIPVPPLDGSWVLEHMFPRTFGPLYERMRPFGIIFFVLLLVSGALSTLLIPAIEVIRAGMGFVALCSPW